jgi:uncharacterized membrane protein
MDPVLAVVFRWLHVIFAALVVGGVFYMRVVLPAGIRHLDEQTRMDVFLRCRRVFKMVIHTAILVLVISGIYNSWRLFDAYTQLRLHGLWGTHILLGLIVFGISLWLLMGKQPPASHDKWSMVNLVLLIILVAVASTLKNVRERRHATAGAAPRDAVPTDTQTP